MPVHKFAKIYVNEIVARHGVLVSIVLDIDGRFTSNFWHDFQEELGTKLHMSTTFHPQMDGQSEWTIKNLEDMLRACVIDFGGNWDDHLPLVKFAYNNSYHASIKMPPYEMLYGRRCRTPIDPKLTTREKPMTILGMKSRQLRNKVILLVKVQLKHRKGSSIRWEPKEKMRTRFECEIKIRLWGRKGKASSLMFEVAIWTCSASEVPIRHFKLLNTAYSLLDLIQASPGNTYSSSSNNSFGLVPKASPTLSLFHDDPYMKVMQAYYAKESPIPPPTIVPPSSMLSLMFNSQELFLPEELLLLKKCGRDRSSSSTSDLPQAFEIGESSRKTSLECHEEQIEEILNHLDELSLDRIEHIEDKIEGLGGKGRGIINTDFDNWVEAELRESRTQIAKLQRKQMGNNNKIALARFRIANVEQIIKDIHVRHQAYKESLLDAIYEHKNSQEGTIGITD
ncbi:putative reverse transcriptase domain-containing protein [Tanacetum coccineum]